LGPLLWHFENNAPGSYGRGENNSSDGNQGSTGIADPGSVELSNDEVIALVEMLGFKVEMSEVRSDVGYIQNPESMLQSTYTVSHWVARKV